MPVHNNISLEPGKNSERLPGKVMLRYLIPILLFSSSFTSLIIIAEQSDFFNFRFAAVWLFLLFIPGSSLLIFFIARSISRENRQQSAQLQSDISQRTSELMKLNETLNKEIADRIKAEKVAEAERKRFNDVLELLPVYIILLTPDYRISYSNRFFRERFGDAGTKRCYEYLFNRTEPCEICETYKALTENRLVTWEWTGPDNNIYSIFDFPFTDSDGSTMIMEMGIDVTSLKKAQAELKILNTELEERVAARTGELKESSERLRILSETSSRLLESGNPHNLINELCTKVMKFLDCDIFFNFLIDEETGKLHLNSYAGIPEETAGRIGWLDPELSVSGCVARAGKRIIAENIPGSDDVRIEMVRSFGIKAYACHPLFSGEKVLGTLSFGTKSRTTFSEEDISMIKTISDEVAIALSRIKYEEALRKSEKNYRLLFDRMTEGFALHEIVIDKAGKPCNYRFLSINPAFEKLTGLKADDLIGKLVTEVLPDTEKYWIDLYGKVALTGESIEFENYHAGLNKYFKVSAFCPNMGYFAAIFENITARVIAEKELRISGEKLKQALQSGNIGTWEWDIENNRIEWDERMDTIFGFAPGTFDGKYDTFEKCLADEDIMHVRGAVNETLNNNAPFEIVYRIMKNGSRNYISSKASIVRSNDGKPVKLSGVCFDITDMKKGAEKALFKLNEDLLRSNRELEQFAYVASHDLQEPLRMVSSYTQLLELRYRDKLDSDAKDFIRYAVDGTVRMQNLINDLLGFSRIETKGREFHSVDMNNSLSQALKNLKFVINERNALITHSNLPILMADESQIVLLFQNLIGNALKFCKKTPRVTISVMEHPDHHVFSVKDNGVGIDAQYFSKIFRIFQRLLPKDEYAGTGIGLAICKRIVERHEGKIWVESELGKGSTFFFTIPKRTNKNHSGENLSSLS